MGNDTHVCALPIRVDAPLHVSTYVSVIPETLAQLPAS
jgi:hypothetical protein